MICGDRRPWLRVLLLVATLCLLVSLCLASSMAAGVLPRTESPGPTQHEALGFTTSPTADTRIQAGTATAGWRADRGRTMSRFALRLATRAARGNAGPVRVGQAGEDAVRGVFDIGDKVPIRVGAARIRDGLTPSTLSEVKNTGSLSYTRQLQDFEQYAQQTGRSFDLYVRPGARLSGRFGCRCGGPDQRVNTSTPYPAALPILLEHLERPYPDRVREGIARALAVHDAKFGWGTLVRLYRQEAPGTDAKDGLAVALAAASDDEVVDEVISLARDSAHGESRLLLSGRPWFVSTAPSLRARTRRVAWQWRSAWRPTMTLSTRQLRWLAIPPRNDQSAHARRARGRTPRRHGRRWR